MLQRFLVLRYNMHPRDAEFIFSSNKTPAICRLVKRCRQVTVKAGEMLCDDAAFGAFTGGGERSEVESDVQHLDTRSAWEQGILGDNEYYDTRAMELLAMCLEMDSQIVVERGGLTDIYGRSVSLNRAGCLLHEGNHFEFVVHRVSYVL